MAPQNGPRSNKNFCQLPISSNLGLVRVYSLLMFEIVKASVMSVSEYRTHSAAKSQTLKFTNTKTFDRKVTRRLVGGRCLWIACVQVKYNRWHRLVQWHHARLTDE